MSPLAKYFALPQGVAAAESEHHETACELTCRVLVVDDHEVVAESIARALRKYGHEVRTAPDGQAALEESEAFRPQIVFADVCLPCLDGVALAARLRRQSAMRNTMLVAVTSYNDEDTMARVRGVFDHWLIKPPTLSAMKSLIRTAASRVAED